MLIHEIIMQLTAFLSPEITPNTPYLAPISIRDRRIFRGNHVRASASAELRVSAAARRGAAAHGVASQCFWKARTHGCLLSESEGERSEDGTLRNFLR